LLEGEEDVQSAEFLGFRDRRAALEVKYSLAAMILADPKGLKTDAARLRLSGAVSDEHFLDSCEAFREIGEQVRSNFAFIAARTQDVRQRDPSMRLGVQSSKISSV
jgi:hypothetical protein